MKRFNKTREVAPQFCDLTGEDTEEYGSTTKKRRKLIFEPDSSAPNGTRVVPNIRLVTVGPTQKFGRSFSVHDLVVVPEFFCKAGDFSFYRKLLQEMEKIEKDNLGQFLQEEYNNHVLCSNV